MEIEFTDEKVSPLSAKAITIQDINSDQLALLQSRQNLMIKEGKLLKNDVTLAFTFSSYLKVKWYALGFCSLIAIGVLVQDNRLEIYYTTVL